MKKIVSFKKLSVFLALIIFLSSVLAGCGGQNAGEKNAPMKVAVYAQMHIPITDWDPSVEMSNGVIVLCNIYETLLKYDPLNKEFIPVLATDYRKSDDGLVWEFDIRENVKFHDGTELNAEAVKFSIERTMELGKGPAFIWDPVDEINVKDDYTVEFKLKYPAALDLIVASSSGAFIMSPTAVKSNPDDWLSKGNEAGTGPYMLESHQMGQEVVFTKFEDYWQGWKDNQIDKAIIKKIPETATRRQLIEKGEVSVTRELPYEDVDSLKDNPNVIVEEGPSFENLFLLFNTEKEPFSNKKVRQALSYAFPYDDVVEYAMGGYALQSKGAIPFGLWGHGKDLFQYEYNLDKAKELLAEAGYPNGGFNLLLTYAAGDEAQKKTAELYKSELAKLNIDLEIRGMPWESQWDMGMDPDPNKRQDIYVMYWWPDLASPYSYLYNIFHSQDEILFDLAYWKNPEFDNLIDEANIQSGIDIEKSEEMFVKAQEIMVEEAPAIFAYDKQYIKIYNKDIKGYVDNPAFPNVVFFYELYQE
ncbi:MAG: ABC transporter substrate-binding protein [Tepidanaerobacteraceae bacterium]